MIKKEAKIITHLSTNEVGEDIHIVKEVYKDDKDIYHDNIKIIKNLKRPFWTTKPIYRNHKEKKEAEDLSKLDMFTTEQSPDLMERNLAPRLGDRYVGNSNLRTMKASPYIYGLDVDSRVFLKRKYNKKYDNYTTSFRYGAFDIEVDTKTDTIIVISLCTNKKLLTYINKYYVRHVKNPYTQIMATYDKYIPDVPTKHNVDIDIKFFDDEISLIKAIFKKANNIEIDILGAWNIKYDISKILERCDKYQVEPKEIFHYDKIPKQYAFFKFKPGRDKTARGAPINPEEQWPTIKSTTNYIMLDAMSTHRYIRVGGKSIPGGYSLENILKHEKINSKLKFDDDNIDGVQGLEWHIWMVENHIIKYIVYNMWDVMSMIELDNKTKDMSKNLPLLSGVSPFEYFNSGPRKIVDAMTFFFLDRKKALGTKSPFQEEDESLGLKDWIVTLPAYNIDNNGLKNIKEDSNLPTNIRLFVYDSDVVSSYPNAGIAANVSKETTHRKLLKIGDISRDVFTKQNMNLMYGSTNAVEYCTNMFNFPSPYDLVDKLEKEKEAA